MEAIRLLSYLRGSGVDQRVIVAFFRTETAEGNIPGRHKAARSVNPTQVAATYNQHGRKLFGNVRPFVVMCFLPRWSDWHVLLRSWNYLVFTIYATRGAWHRGLLFEEISRLVQRSPEIVGKQRGDQGLHESYPRADHKDRKNVKLRPTVLPWYLLQLLGSAGTVAGWTRRDVNRRSFPSPLAGWLHSFIHDTHRHAGTIPHEAKLRFGGPLSRPCLIICHLHLCPFHQCRRRPSCRWHRVSTFFDDESWRRFDMNEACQKLSPCEEVVLKCTPYYGARSLSSLCKSCDLRATVIFAGYLITY
ncbi:hypothetical protein KC338_g134 [Hortaea werneckii]|nr:hypothetical protein KC338_g134 [Hortaea werneckii]